MMSVAATGKKTEVNDPLQWSPLSAWAVEAIADHDVSPMIERVVGECARLVFPDIMDDSMFIEALADSVAENVRSLRDVLRGVLPLSDLLLVRPLRFAEIEAERRIPHASLQRSYRISFAIQWDEWAAVLARAAEKQDVVRGDALEVTADLTRLMNVYSEAVISSVALSFARSEETYNKSRTHVRQRLIREILEGGGSTLSPADLITLDYSLGACHLAIHLPETPQAAAQRVLDGLRAVVNPMYTMIYPVTLGSSVIWLGLSTRWADDRIERVVDHLAGAGLPAAVSEPASELSGFHRTFLEVRQVQEIRTQTPKGELPEVMRYRDLRLEILLLQNRDLAAEFVVQELGPLAERTAEAAKLRATLEASFRIGSHVATAEHLQLHEHTVRNRLQKAEDLLGSTRDRRTELQVALRLWRILVPNQ